ncbi:MAG: hypothetical protein JWO14_1830 [Solirubrobacterales bacterium]|nr:hypothetical protein [Solirubrobacterales bacterium]
MYVSRALRLGPSRHLRAIGICAAIAVGASLGVLAPAAMAAPANDHFANRAPLTGPLPIQVSESNVEATREAGEPSLGPLGSAGHSIWWAWEASATEWVTVSTCQSPIASVVAVFEGTELATLARVAEGNADEGPSCLFEMGKTYTFRAHAGHHYAIAADGNGFYVPAPPGDPEPPRPVVEGEIKLTIEATPVPPNDNFEAATPIEHPTFEEPDGNRGFLTQVQGYNWGATKQPGEPEHAGEPGGASVWFSWVAPETGEAAIGTGVGVPGVVAVYTGDAVGSLTPIGSSAESLVAVHVPVVGGTNYMIAVDGKGSSGTPGEPEMGSFELTVAEKLKPGPGYPLPQVSLPSGTTVAQPGAEPAPSPPSRVRNAPVVEIIGHRVDSRPAAVTFRFRSATKGAKFKCAVDGKGYKACSSPFTSKGLKPGKHVFRVLAGANGATGAGPAVVHFTVPAPRRRKHAAG